MYFYYKLLNADITIPTAEEEHIPTYKPVSLEPSKYSLLLE